MHARAVHARVEALLGESVRWASVKATLAGNLAGPQLRFVRVARGRYRFPSPRTQGCAIRQRTRRPLRRDRGGLARVSRLPLLVAEMHRG